MFPYKSTAYWKILTAIVLTLVVLTPSYVPRVYAPNANLSEWTLPDGNSGPWGIAIDLSNKVWFTENQTNRLAMLDRVTNTLKEWNTPSGGSNPKYVYVKPSGSGVRVYFTEYSSNKVAYLDNATNTFFEWSLPGGPDAKPVGITVDNDDHIWVTESGRDAIAEVIPVSNIVNEYKLPARPTPVSTSQCASVSVQLCPWGIYVQSVSTISGTNKFVWFTELNNNAIGRLEASSHVLTLFNLRTINPFNYAPMDITLDSSGNALFTDADFTANRISMIRNQTSTLADFSIPRSQAKATSIKWDPVHNLAWFTENNGGRVTSLDTSGGVFTFLPQTIVCTIGGTNTAAPDCASGSSYTGSIGAGLSTSTVTPNTRSVTPSVSTFASQDSGVFSEYALPTSISGPNSVTVDSSGGIWFTEQQSSGNRIGYMNTVVPFNFGLSVNTNTVTINQGQSANYTLNVNLISGTTQPVTLAISPTPPAGVTYSFTPASGTPGFTSTLALGTTSATPAGTYAFTVSASGGSVIKTVPVNLIVVAGVITTTTAAFDFELVVNGQTSASIVAGQSTTFNIGINLVGSATPQSVQLFASGQPAGVTATFNPATGLPSFTSTLTLASTVDTSPGDYQITTTGTGGGKTHTTTVSLTITSPIKDFTLTVSPTSLNLPQASSGTAAITVQSVGVFNDPVSLAASNEPGGSSVSFTPNPITPPVGGTAISTATVSVTRSVPTGTYSFTITATSGSITHTATVTLHVSGCLIATATYGSELSPEVQFLRDFRDYQILHTFAGTNFMIAFNTWYYSFSPTVASYIATHETVKTAMKFVLYPLIGVLHVSSASYAMLSFEPEIAALIAGIVASSLIGFVYLALPVSSAIWFARRRLQKGTEKRIAKSLASLFLVLLTGFAISELLAVPVAMILISAAIILTVLAIGTLLPAFAVVEFVRRRN